MRQRKDLTRQINTVIVGNKCLQWAVEHHPFMPQLSVDLPGNIFTDYIARLNRSALHDLSTTQSNVVFYWANDGLMRVLARTVAGKPVKGSRGLTYPGQR